MTRKYPYHLTLLIIIVPFILWQRYFRRFDLNQMCEVNDSTCSLVIVSNLDRKNAMIT